MTILVRKWDLSSEDILSFYHFGCLSLPSEVMQSFRDTCSKMTLIDNKIKVVKTYMTLFVYLFVYF